MNCVINMVKFEFDFIFITIDKIYIVGMDVSVKGLLMWEEVIVFKEKL